MRKHCTDESQRVMNNVKTAKHNPDYIKFGFSLISEQLRDDELLWYKTLNRASWDGKSGGNHRRKDHTEALRLPPSYQRPAAILLEQGTPLQSSRPSSSTRKQQPGVKKSSLFYLYKSDRIERNPVQCRLFPDCSNHQVIKPTAWWER